MTGPSVALGDFPEPSSPIAKDPSEPPQFTTKPSLDSLKSVWDRPIALSPYSPSSPSTSSRPLPQQPSASSSRVALPGMTPSRQASLPSPYSQPSSPVPEAFSPKEEATVEPVRSRTSRILDLSSSPSTSSRFERPLPSPNDISTSTTTKSSFFAAERPAAGSTLTWKKPTRPAPGVDWTTDLASPSSSKDSATQAPDLKSLVADQNPLGISCSSRVALDVFAFQNGSLSSLDDEARKLFYSQETIFLVHRGKGSDDLVSTSLIVWHGSDVDPDDRQREAKVDEMAQRYKARPVGLLAWNACKGT
jgi:hypothetical protein